MTKAKNKEKETEATAAVEVETGASNQNESHTFDQIEKLGAFMASLGFEISPEWISSSGPVVAAIDYIKELLEQTTRLTMRIAELEANAPIETHDAASTAADEDLAVEAYDLFCKGQSEGDYPAWPELSPQTQKLWRDSYDHVAQGGAPRTDYEYTVKYLVVSAR